MEMKPVQSSNITEIGFDFETGTLGIAFSRGATYHYEGVPPDLYNELMAAESKGTFFNANILGKFKATKQEAA